jgi:hypothetical protein
MKERLQKQVKSLLDQAKQADKVLAELHTKVKQFDKQSAKATVGVIRSQGKEELLKLKEKLQTQLMEVSSELVKKSEKLKLESAKVRGRVKDTLEVVKTQIKNESSKLKRRGGS